MGRIKEFGDAPIAGARDVEGAQPWLGWPPPDAVTVLYPPQIELRFAPGGEPRALEDLLCTQSFVRAVSNTAWRPAI
jgi:hypothetical protein